MMLVQSSVHNTAHNLLDAGSALGIHVRGMLLHALACHPLAFFVYKASKIRGFDLFMRVSKINVEHRDFIPHLEEGPNYFMWLKVKQCICKQM